MQSRRPDADLEVTGPCSLSVLKGHVTTLILCLAALAPSSIPFVLLYWLLLPIPGTSGDTAPARLEPLGRRIESLVFGLSPSRTALAAFAQGCAQPEFAKDCAQQRDIKRPTNRKAHTSKRKRFRPHRRKNAEPTLVKKGDPALAHDRDWRKAVP